MENLMNLFHIRGGNVTMRPLLYATGAAATTAGVYYYIRNHLNHNDEERTVNNTNIPLTADPLQTLSADVPYLDRSSTSNVDVSGTTEGTPPEDSLSETEEMNLRPDVSRALVDRETSDQEDRESELEEHLCEAHSEPESETQVCPGEAAIKYRATPQTIADLMEKETNTRSKINRLKETVNELGNMICDVQSECTETSKRYEAEQILCKSIKAEYLTIEEKYLRTVCALKVSLAEAERQLEIRAQVSRENSRLKSVVEVLEGLLETLGTQLTDNQRRCNEMMRECEETKQKLSTLQSEYNELKNFFLEGEPELHHVLMSQNAKLNMVLDQKQDLLKMCEMKNEEVVKTRDELEDKNLDLISQVNTLLDTQQELQTQLSETRRNCYEITRERDQAQEAQRIQEIQCRTMSDALKRCTEALNEPEQVIQKTQYNQVINNEELLKAALADAKRKYEQEIEYRPKLDNEKSVLISKVTKLQDDMDTMTHRLAVAHKFCNESKRDCARVAGSIHFIKAKYKKKLKLLKQDNDALKVCLDSAKQKYEDLMDKNQHLRYNIEEIWPQIHDREVSIETLHRQCSSALSRCTELQKEAEQKNEQLSVLDSKWTMMNESILKDHDAEIRAHHTLQLQYNEIEEQHKVLLKKYEQEQEAYSNLKLEYDQMKESLLNNEKSQSVSQAKAEVKCDQVIESSVQQDDEISDLMAQVNTLQSSVQQMKEQLSQTHVKCEKLTRERDQEREAHSTLKSEYDQMKAQYKEMMETLKQCREVLSNHSTDLGL